jgi:hypothetical protein
VFQGIGIVLIYSEKGEGGGDERVQRPWRHLERISKRL